MSDLKRQIAKRIGGVTDPDDKKSSTNTAQVILQGMNKRFELPIASPARIS